MQYSLFSPSLQKRFIFRGSLVIVNCSRTGVRSLNNICVRVDENIMTIMV